MLIGLVSDTHGSLTKAAQDALVGCDHIIHAGDIGSLSVLLRLQAIAPVTAVLGNCDYNDFGWDVRRVARTVIDGVSIYITHRPRDICDIGNAQLVVHGHTHVRRDEHVDGVRYVNPGSATSPRDLLPPCVAIACTGAGFVRSVSFVDL